MANIKKHSIKSDRYKLTLIVHGLGFAAKGEATMTDDVFTRYRIDQPLTEEEV